MILRVTELEVKLSHFVIQQTLPRCVECMRISYSAEFTAALKIHQKGMQKRHFKVR